MVKEISQLVELLTEKDRIIQQYTLRIKNQEKQISQLLNELNKDKEYNHKIPFSFYRDFLIKDTKHPTKYILLKIDETKNRNPTLYLSNNLEIVDQHVLASKRTFDSPGNLNKNSQALTHNGLCPNKQQFISNHSHFNLPSNANQALDNKTGREQAQSEPALPEIMGRLVSKESITLEKSCALLSEDLSILRQKLKQYEQILTDQCVSEQPKKAKVSFGKVESIENKSMDNQPHNQKEFLKRKTIETKQHTFQKQSELPKSTTKESPSRLQLPERAQITMWKSSTEKGHMEEKSNITKSAIYHKDPTGGKTYSPYRHSKAKTFYIRH